MACEATQKPDVLLVVTSDRYGTGQFGTIKRLVDAALRGGYSLQVWACGYANMLTQRGSAEGGQPAEPAAAELIGGLVTEHAESFSWVACRTCSDDHGADGHIDGVLTEPSFANFHEYVANAAKVVYIGGD